MDCRSIIYFARYITDAVRLHKEKAKEAFDTTVSRWKQSGRWEGDHSPLSVEFKTEYEDLKQYLAGVEYPDKKIEKNGVGMAAFIAESLPDNLNYSPEFIRAAVIREAFRRYIEPKGDFYITPAYDDDTNVTVHLRFNPAAPQEETDGGGVHLMYTGATEEEAMYKAVVNQKVPE